MNNKLSTQLNNLNNYNNPKEAMRKYIMNIKAHRLVRLPCNVFTLHQTEGVTFLALYIKVTKFWTKSWQSDYNIHWKDETPVFWNTFSFLSSNDIMFSSFFSTSYHIFFGFKHWSSACTCTRPFPDSVFSS